MALEIKLNQKLSQALVMTPQLQQAIKLLQLGRQEYLEVIERELLENPVLEEAGEDDRRQGQGEAAAEESFNGEAEQGLAASPLLTFEEPEESYGDKQQSAKDYLASLGEEGGFSYDYARTGRGESDHERPSLEATVSSPEGLSSHLLWQLRTGDLSEEDEDIAVHIIGNLDRNGYLCCSAEEIGEACRRSVEDILRVLSLVQTLDPPGIAARDLRECLSIQLEQLGMRDTLAWKIVQHYLGELEVKRYDVIARREHVTVEEVYSAVRDIQRLEPRPGRPFVDETPIYITPDVYVRKVGDDYVITLNESGIPRLRLSSHYRELLNNGADKGGAVDKEYLQDRLRSASWLIRSIHQRQQTIYRVTESIMKFQREFLEHGVCALKPLVLRDVASDVGMHESTVSRVTTNKYVHTPQGVFELKFFFSSGVKSGDGEVSSESVKERIRELIGKENPHKPLSDQAIVRMLRDEGVDIARRTVAKYREMMNILSSSRRKKMF